MGERLASCRTDETGVASECGLETSFPRFVRFVRLVRFVTLFSSGRSGRSGSGFVGRRLPATPAPLRLLAVGLGGYLFQLASLPRRQGLTRCALLQVAEGAAIGLDAFGDALDELALPFGQGDARLVGGPFSPFESVQSLAARGLALGLERAGRSPGFGLGVLLLKARPGLEPGRALERPPGTVLRGAFRTARQGRPLQDQISPSADRYRSRIASSSWRLALSCFLMRMTLRRILTS